ncbi:NUDIX hydrolase [Ensifer sp. ENS12]|uniref:NUDIX hydrolase n=1 Tax=Ensifer sp. ENS12 TaxID=2854774 RepID=UPI001C4944FA|nr:NUDIX hydrolase [Ensifer sp. ENS12]MBV7518832.1 NUDIX hydrolase [Ensifer sp. ENS12]
MTMQGEVKVCVDTVLLTFKHERLNVALAPLGPEDAALALLGAVMDGSKDVALDDIVRHTLRDRTGLEDVYFEQLFTFSGEDQYRRDPRWPSISVAYLALIPYSKLASAENSLNSLRLVPVDEVPALPFDHNRIIDTAVARLRGKGSWSVLPAYLLDEEFTISQLNRVYSAVTSTFSFGQNFRRKVLENGMLTSAGFKSAPGATKKTEHFRVRPGVSTVDAKL